MQAHHLAQARKQCEAALCKIKERQLAAAWRWWQDFRLLRRHLQASQSLCWHQACHWQARKAVAQWHDKMVYVKRLKLFAHALEKLRLVQEKLHMRNAFLLWHHCRGEHCTLILCDLQALIS
jgi:hypothetical protein